MTRLDEALRALRMRQSRSGCLERDKMPRGTGRAGRGCGSVALVGCGPGDPDLLTLRAARVIAGADVLVYDRLVSPAIVALGRANAQRVYVGKARADHAMPQDEIGALLVRLAQEGRRVARLKGGDPLIFGRGGEEIEALVRHGIPLEVVPGITAAAGIAASAGIPLTHRDHSHSVTLVAGHLKNGSADLDWPALVRPGQTLVIYMGLCALPAICRELIAHGMPEATPAAIVQHGTLPSQRVVTGTLADLPERAASACLEPPTLIIIGDVIGLYPMDASFLPKRKPEAVNGSMPGRTSQVRHRAT